MLAMQYSFPLPADYDMAVIRRRIADKGKLMDEFPGLSFKIFLYAERAPGGSAENLYAPMYVWTDERGLRRFLTSKGFEALCSAFGWPRIRTWLPIHWSGEPKESAISATRVVLPISAHTDLAALETQERGYVDDARSAPGCTFALSAYDPQTWTVARFTLGKAEVAVTSQGVQAYRVGYVATSKTPFDV